MKRKESDYDKLDTYLYPEGRGQKRETYDSSRRYSGFETQRNYFSRSGERTDRYAFQRPRKLFKSRSDKKILGVCGGLAAYFNLSSTVIRILFIIIFVLGWGTLALVYLILALVLPEEPYEITREHYLRRF
jgi:phage shock protein C